MNSNTKTKVEIHIDNISQAELDFYRGRKAPAREDKRIKLWCTLVLMASMRRGGKG